jgi:hypothetical protein
MSQSGRELNLAAEPFLPDRGSELGAHDLDRDLPGMFEIVGQVNARHSPMAELAAQAVAAGERFDDLVKEEGHARAPSRCGTQKH